MRVYSKASLADVIAIMSDSRLFKIGSTSYKYIDSCKLWKQGGTFESLYVCRNLKTLNYKVFNEKELIGKKIVTYYTVDCLID